MEKLHYAWKSAALLLLTLGARTAMADSGIAYAWINNGASASVSAQYSFNPSGGAVTASHTGTGSYTVTFPNSGIGTGWSVQATAYGATANYCNVASWGGSLANVKCYTPAGAAADTAFTVLAVSNVNDKDIFFAWADQPTAASYTPNTSYSYSISGVKITRSNPGTYNVTFTGLGGAGGTVQIDAYGSNASCYSGGWSGSSSMSAAVDCFDPSGNPVDSYFVINIVPSSDSEFPDNPITPAGLAFSWANQDSTATYAPSSLYTYSPTGSDVNITRSSTGQYLLTFAGLNIAQVVGGNARATAYSAHTRCNVESWTPGSGATLQVAVGCYNVAGVATDSEYEVLLLPPEGYAYTWIYDATAASVSATYTVNPGGVPVTANHFATGVYGARFPNSGCCVGWTVQAIAYGGGANYCEVEGWDSLGDVDLLCFNTAGAPADSEFTVLAVSNTNDKNIAFAWFDQPGVASYSPDLTYAYNPGGAISLTRSGTGNYSVVFDGLNGAGGTVQVAPAVISLTLDAYCSIGSWSGSNFTVSVRCTDPTGANVDAAFTVAVIPAGAAPAGVGYAWANLDTSASYTPDTTYSYNSSGGAISATRSGVGTYQMAFAGLAAGLVGGDVRVTSYNSLARCKVASWSSGGADLLANVNCYTPTGSLVDSDYTILVMAPVIGAPASGAPGAVLVNTGSPQSTLVNTAFPTALSALVTDGIGNPFAGATVTFTAPGSGASGTFPGSTLTATANTNASGVATAPVFTANGTAGGPYVVTASVLGVSTPANFSLTNIPLTAVTLQTSPPGLMVSLDGGAFTAAPLNASLAPGSSHTIATETPQAGAAGTQFVFSNWSDSGAIQHSITVPSSAITYTANFQTQYQLTTAASPVAGGSVTPASGTFYNAGTVVPVTATANAGYSFTGWSGPVASASSASTTVTMSAPETVTANFSLPSAITIQTVPPGLQISVDSGPSLTAPQTVSLSLGSHTIAVATLQAGTPGTQYAFSAWSDGGAASHSIVVTSSAATYTATFTTQYLLTTAVSPSAAGTVGASPASPGYYNAGTSVQLTATAGAGFQFSNWTGDLSGATNPQSILMNGSHSVTANFSAIAPLCSLVLTPSSISLPATGTSTVETCPNGSGQPNCGVLPEIPANFSVAPSAACGAWTATSSNPSVLPITSGASGNGAGGVSYALLNNTHTLPQTYTITVASGAVSVTYAVTEAGSGDNQVYREVYALYEQFLGRDPDAAGFAFWTGTGGAGLGQMADSFLTSPEAYNSDFAVMATYQAATGAPPTFAQFIAAVSAIRANTQTIPGLFNSLIGGSYSATNLYQNLLNRAPGAGDSSCTSVPVANCFQTLIGYPTNTTPVGDPNNEFQSTGTFHTTDHTNGLYVQMIYYVTLSRDPDAAGLAFWTGIANGGGPGLLFQGNAGFSTRIQILGPGTPNQGFIGSPEFQGLFAN